MANSKTLFPKPFARHGIRNPKQPLGTWNICTKTCYLCLRENCFMPIAYLMTGSNLGNREENLKKATGEISGRAGRILYLSGMYVSDPWGNAHQEKFLNQLVVIETKTSARELLNICLATEQSLGRVRNKEQNSPRTIDIDILFYGNDIIREDGLLVPHPRLHLRNFCLIPLLEVHPALVHPVFDKTVWQLYRECEDTGRVYPLNAQEP